MRKTVVVFVRHAETSSNAKGIWQGWTDTWLDSRGKRQARQVAKRLRDFKFDAVYCSDLRRALQTAEEIMKYHPRAKLTKLKALREKDFGVFEDYTTEELKTKKAGPYEKYSSVRNRITVRCPGGESWQDVFRRAAKAVRSILKKHRGGKVLLVSHGGTIRLLLAWLLGRPLAENILFDHNNTGVSIVVVFSRGAELLLFNDTSHARAPF